jgi:hypothetical protein
MKKLIASAGLAAIGASSLYGAYAPGLSSTETAKPWSVSASLRGFYDDNFTTSPNEIDTFGIQISPSVSYNISLDTTYIGLSYTYSLRNYFEDGTNDQSHRFNGKLSHAFTERWKLDVDERFAIAQEAEVLEGSGPLTTVLRTDGDNLSNRLRLDLNGQLTEQFGILVGYGNRIFDYSQEVGDSINGFPIAFNSKSGLLDRVEHRARLNLRWQALPQTVGVLGYEYGVVDYNSDDALFAPKGFAGSATSDIRDNESHYVYIGADQTFNPQLNGSIRAGAQFISYDDPASSDDVSPYVDGKLSYTYLPGSYVQGGIRHSFVSTDIIGTSGTNPTLDQESTTIYGSLNHKITAKLNGSILGQVQFSEFNGGPGIDGENENIYIVGLNLTYQINKFIAAEAGYNYDNLDSDIPNRSFSRNRVYIGVRASY